MKNVKNFLAIASLAAGMFIMNACTDPCKDVTCLNGGVCDEGDCICATGYEGTDCATESRTKFIGSYEFIDGCYPGINNTANISTSAEGVTKVNISNILGDDLGGSAKATIDGSKITIASQQVMDKDNDPWTVEGKSTGTFANNAFSISMQITYGTSSQSCLFSFTKK